MMELEKLINNIKNGTESKEVLYEYLTDFINIQKKVNLKYTRDNLIDPQELLTFIWLGIETAIKTYSVNKNCRFLTWASSCIRFCILSERQKAGFSYISLNAPIDEENQLSAIDTICDPLAEEAFGLIDNQDNNAVLSAFKSLPKTEKEIIERCCLKGNPLSKVAKELNISSTQARTLKIRALRMLKDALMAANKK